MEGRVYSGATVLFHHAVAARMGMHPTDLRCLDLIVTGGPLTAGQLAELTGLTTGAMTTVLDRLERAKLVRRTRDPRDRRRVVLEATPPPAFVKRITGMYASIAAAWEKLCSRYSTTELERFLEFMRRSREMVREETRKVRGTGGRRPGAGGGGGGGGGGQRGT
ncbi:MAG TPA: MarR family transcriptional regulator [Gemmatimonadaceae bacterium]